MRRRLFSFTFLWLVLLSGNAPAEPSDMRGTIYGQSHVNLRPGPDLKRPPQGMLREGQQVIVQGEEGSWYLISLPDGRRGYVNKAWVRLLDEVRTKETIPEANAIATEKTREKGSQVSPMQEFGGENQMLARCRSLEKHLKERIGEFFFGLEELYASSCLAGSVEGTTICAVIALKGPSCTFRSGVC